MELDPRTSLKIVEVPPEHTKYFSDLKDTVTHWIGVVNKFNRMWKPDKRVAIFSDQCIYLCRLDGGITRCVQVRNIDRVLLGEDSAIGLKIHAPDYDMLLQFSNVTEREAALSIIKKVYNYLVGKDVVVKQMSEEASKVMQQELDLTKPPGFTVRIEPIRSQKALARSIAEQQKRDADDRKIVEQEFERIKEGLHRELTNHRTEEYDRLVEQIGRYVKELEAKDREIARLKTETVSRDDPELWKSCPNCAALQTRLSSNSNDDKQKIIKLEREIESQHHIMQHLQAAIQHRSTAAASAMGVPTSGASAIYGGLDGGGADATVVVQLRQELSDANRRNKELQQLIAQSPMLTAEAKQRAARIGTQRDGQSYTTSYTNSDWSALVTEKEKEVKHLKSVLRDSTFRHVQELEAIRSQFQKYDEQIVEYLEKVFNGNIQPSGRGGPASQMARATAMAAQEAAGGAPNMRSMMARAQAMTDSFTLYGNNIDPSPRRVQSQVPTDAPSLAATSAIQPMYSLSGGRQSFDPSSIPSASAGRGPSNPLHFASGAPANPAFSPSSIDQFSPIQRNAFGGAPTYTPQRGGY